MGINESCMLWVKPLLAASPIALMILALCFAVRKIYILKTTGEVRRLGISRLLLFSAVLIFSILCLRYAVALYQLALSGTAPVALRFEKLFDSFVHVLQTFSMDEDYSECLKEGKALVAFLYGADSWRETVYGLYCSALNFIAPVVGGAVIFEILANIFPRLKLVFSHLAFWREKLYFSELNAASLELARSLLREKNGLFGRPIAIFCDYYSSGNEENDSEQYVEARLLGAICIRDDICHIIKGFRGKSKFFLIDEKRSDNLQTLVKLANKHSYKSLARAEILLFTDDDSYLQVERRVNEKLENEFGMAKKDLPVIEPVLGYRNLVSRLLVEVPLFEPLIDKERNANGERDLAVTVLGVGSIGIEMFLASYWMGQMLDCKLTLNVLSRESEEEFVSRIDFINPDIKHTTVEGDDILVYNRKGDRNPVYCKVNYFSCDVRYPSALEELRQSDGKRVLDSDYFFISLGSDDDNISVANSLKRLVGKKNVENENCGRTVITYVVYDSDIAETLNRKKRFSSLKNGYSDIYMYATGGIREVYGAKNVFLEDYEELGNSTHEAYLSAQRASGRAKAHHDRMNDDYKYWANIARAMHLKYRMFSMGAIDRSLFDFSDAEEELHRRYTNRVYAEYMEMIKGNVSFEKESDREEHIKKLHRMAWLEHRRWNAFTRVKGFRDTSGYGRYANKNESGSHKHMELMLHPALVECGQDGIIAELGDKFQVVGSTLLNFGKEDCRDFLDERTYELYKSGLIAYDFKQSDYPFAVDKDKKKK